MGLLVPVLGVLVALVAAHVWPIRHHLVPRAAPRQLLDQCQALPLAGLGGASEDLATDAAGRLWLGPDERTRYRFRNEAAAAHPSAGGIAVLEPGEAAPVPVPLLNPEALLEASSSSDGSSRDGDDGSSGDWRAVLHVHGLGVTPDGSRLFAVVHPPGSDAVIVFDVVPNPAAPKAGEQPRRRQATVALRVAHVVRDLPHTRYLNDVEPVSEREFYATQWVRYPYHSAGEQVDSFLRLTGDKGAIRCVLDGGDDDDAAAGTWSCAQATASQVPMVMPNGIATLPDMKTLFVLDAAAAQFHVFARDVDTGDLTHLETVPTISFCDNVWVDRRPRQDPLKAPILSGCHYAVLKLGEHAKEPTSKHSPSQTLQFVPTLNTPHGVPYSIVQHTLDDGSRFSGQASAAIVGDRLYLSAIYQPDLMVCPWNPDAGVTPIGHE